MRVSFLLLLLFGGGGGGGGGGNKIREKVFQVSNGRDDELANFLLDSYGPNRLNRPCNGD